MPLYLVLLGFPGAGKGTQAHRLSQAFGLTRIATGDLLRRIAREDHTLGHRVRSILSTGHLVDDETVFAVVRHYLETVAQGPGVILDGFPRNLRQALQLEQYLSERGQWNQCWAVYLNIPEDAAVQRLTARRICPRCERVYNLVSRPSRLGDRCEVCQTPLEQRADDAEEVVRQRLSVYYAQTVPLVEHFHTRQRLVIIDASLTEDVVFNTLARYVRQWLVGAPDP